MISGTVNAAFCYFSQISLTLVAGDGESVVLASMANRTQFMKKFWTLPTPPRGESHLKMSPSVPCFFPHSSLIGWLSKESYMVVCMAVSMKRCFSSY